MTFTKNWKSIGAAVLALAAISSVSVMTFAQEAKSVPMTKIVTGAATSASVPASSINGAGSSKDTVVSVKLTDLKGVTSMSFADAAKTVDVRTNEKTGKMEISEDGGKTWKVYEGEVMPAVACTPATPAKPAK